MDLGCLPSGARGEGRATALAAGGAREMMEKPSWMQQRARMGPWLDWSSCRTRIRDVMLRFGLLSDPCRNASRRAYRSAGLVLSCLVLVSYKPRRSKKTIPEAKLHPPLVGEAFAWGSVLRGVRAGLMMVLD